MEEGRGESGKGGGFGFWGGGGGLWGVEGGGAGLGGGLAGGGASYSDLHSQAGVGEHVEEDAGVQTFDPALDKIRDLAPSKPSGELVLDRFCGSGNNFEGRRFSEGDAWSRLSRGLASSPDSGCSN